MATKKLATQTPPNKPNYRYKVQVFFSDMDAPEAEKSVLEAIAIGFPSKEQGQAYYDLIGKMLQLITIKPFNDGQ